MTDNPPMVSPRVLVYGAGWLGRRLARDLPGFLSTVDICDRAAVRAELARVRPDAVVNAAGKTGRPNVDWCEANRDATWRANVDGPRVLADECGRVGAYLLHLGSGCVFQGGGGWCEWHPADPPSFYARTKLAADLALDGVPGVGVARVRMPVDRFPHPRNLVTKLAGYRRVHDVVNSVTVVDDLVGACRRLVAARADGIFHVVNPGAVSHRDLVGWYRELVDPSHPAPEFVDPASDAGRGLTVAARSACVLASPRLDGVGIALRPARDAVRDALVGYAEFVRAAGAA